MFPLGLLGSGERGEIIAVRLVTGTEAASGKPEARIEDLGLRVGKTVEMLTNAGGGPLLLKIDELRIAIARGMAMKILVRRQS